MCLAFAAHVFDEAIHNFLAFYNPIVIAARGKFSLLPLPIFHFQAWLTLLLIIIIVLLALSTYAFQAARWMRPLSYIFAGIMIANGLLHLAGFVIMRVAIPGVFSSPLLLLAAAYLLIITRKAKE